MADVLLFILISMIFLCVLAFFVRVLLWLAVGVIDTWEDEIRPRLEIIKARREEK